MSLLDKLDDGLKTHICNFILDGNVNTPSGLVTDDEFRRSLPCIREAFPDIHSKIVECIDPLHPLEKSHGINFDWVTFLSHMTKKELFDFAKENNIEHSCSMNRQKHDIIANMASGFRRDPATMLLTSTIDRIEKNADKFEKCQRNPEKKRRYQDLIDMRRKLIEDTYWNGIVESQDVDHSLLLAEKLSTVDHLPILYGLRPSTELHRLWRLKENDV